MSVFREAFLIHVPSADPTNRRFRETSLSRTALIPVPDRAAAAAIAAELLDDDGLDLIELYGGFALETAAAVVDATGGRVPVGAVSIPDRAAAGTRAAIFEAPGADPAVDRYVFEHTEGQATIVAAPDAAAVPAIARDLVDAGVQRIELCGGLGVVPAAAVIAAVGDRASVAAVTFGFESLPGAAGYRARFEEALAA